jgi:DNA-binding IclR family transcriptional regulator
MRQETSQASGLAGSTARPRREAVVKSAARVLRILEHFDHVRRPCSARDVALALGYPESSTQALLRSLVATGYLRLDAPKRHYAPTLRVSLLGAGWIAPQLCGATALQSLMEGIAQRTDGQAGIVMRNADHAEVILASRSAGAAEGPGRERIAEGAAGRALLVGLQDAEIRRLLHRLNADAAARGLPRMDAAEVLRDLGTLRHRGWLAMAAPGDAWLGQIAMPLHAARGMGALALVLTTPRAVMQTQAALLARVMGEECAAWLGAPDLGWTVKRDLHPMLAKAGHLRPFAQPSRA